MPRRPAPGNPSVGWRAASPKPVPCPFIIVSDSREGSPYRFAGLSDDAEAIESDPYTFDGLVANADKRYARLIVRTVRIGQPRGDYSILGLSGQPTKGVDGKPQGGGGSSVIVERKSLSDFYGSVGRRANFVGRLEAMQAADRRGHIVVEASIDRVANDPPPYTQLNPRAVVRTVQSWANDYPAVHWWFLPDRAWAEAWTFRLLEDWWRKHRLEVRDVTVIDQATGEPVRSVPGALDGEFSMTPKKAKRKAT